MLKYGDLLAHTIQIDDRQFLLVEAPKALLPSGFTDSDRKKISSIGYTLSGQNLALSEMSDETTRLIADLTTALKTAPIDAKASNYEKSKQIAVFPAGIVFNGTNISPKIAYSDTQQPFVIIPRPANNKDFTALLANAANHIGFSESASQFAMKLTPENVLALSDYFIASGLPSTRVNIVVKNIDQLPVIKRAPDISRIIAVIDDNDKKTGRILILPRGGEFKPSIEANINISLNHQGKKSTFAGGEKLYVLDSSSALTELTMPKTEVLELPLSSIYDTKIRARKWFPLSPDQQASALEATLYLHTQSPPIKVFQPKVESLTSPLQFITQNGVIIAAPSALRDRISSLIPSQEVRDKAETKLNYGAKNGVPHTYSYSFNRLDSAVIFTELNDLMTFNGPLTHEELTKRPQSQITLDSRGPLESVKDYYKSIIRTESDAVDMITGQLNTRFTDHLMNAVSAELSGRIDYAQTVSANKPAQRGSNYTYAPNKCFGVERSKSGSKNRALLIKVNDDNMPTVSLQKLSGKNSTTIASINLGKTFYEWYVNELDNDIAKVATGADYSRIIAREEKIRQDLAASLEQARIRQENKEKQDRLDLLKIRSDFWKKYSSSESDVTQSKELSRKGLDLTDSSNNYNLRITTVQNPKTQANIQQMLVPVITISASKPELNGLITTGQLISHDGSSSVTSSKLYLTKAPMSESRLGKGTTAVYPATPFPISNTDRLASQSSIDMPVWDGPTIDPSEIKQYVVTEGWAEAVWYAENLQKKNIKGVSVLSAGSAGNIPEVIRILEEKFPFATKTILADNDTYKLETPNAGINAVLDSAIALKENGLSTSNLNYYSITPQAFERFGLERITDMTDLVSPRPVSEVEAIMHAMGYKTAQVYSGDNSFRPGEYIPEDVSVSEAVQKLQIQDGSKQNIPLSLARNVINERLFSEATTNLRDLDGNKKTLFDKDNSDVGLARLFVIKATKQAMPVTLTVYTEAFTIINGVPTSTGHAPLQIREGENNPSNIRIDKNNAIVYSSGDFAARQVIPKIEGREDLQREHYVSSDGVITVYKQDVDKKLMPTYKEGESFIKAHLVADGINTSVADYFRKSITQYVNGHMDSSNDSSHSNVIQMTQRFATALKNNYINTVNSNPDYQYGLKQINAAMQNEDTATFGYEYTPYNISDYNKKENNLFYSGLNDDSKYKEFVGTIAGQIIASRVSATSNLSTIKKIQSQDYTEPKNERTLARSILNAIKNSPHGYCYFPLKDSDESVMFVAQNPVQIDTYSVMKYVPFHNVNGKAFEITEEQILAGALNSKIAIIPADPTSARIRVAEQLAAKHIMEHKNPEERAVMMAQARKEEESRLSRESFVATGLHREIFTESKNSIGMTLGAKFSDIIVGKSEVAESHLSVPKASMSMYVSLRGDKNDTHQSLAEKNLKKFEDELADYKASSPKPSEEVVAHLQGKINAVREQYNAAIAQGKIKGTHTASKVGKSVAIFSNNLAFVMSGSVNGTHYTPATDMLMTIQRESRAFANELQSYFVKDDDDRKISEATNRFQYRVIPINDVEVNSPLSEKGKMVLAPLLNVPTDHVPFARIIAHDILAGSKILPYKVINPFSLKTDTSRELYRGKPKDLQVVIETAQKLKREGVDIKAKFMTLPIESKDLKYTSQSELFRGENKKLFGIFVDSKSVPILNDELSKLGLLSLAEYRHQKDPINNPSPFITAAQKGISEAEIRSIIADYAENPPTRLRSDDPTNVEKIRSNLLSEQKRQQQKQFNEKEKQVEIIDPKDKVVSQTYRSK